MKLRQDDKMLREFGPSSLLIQYVTTYKIMMVVIKLFVVTDNRKFPLNNNLRILTNYFVF